ncbi:chromosome partitioning protein ParA [Prochlorococcus marinus str. MU1402]|uniref:ParA family protein n=1 Tax=Prochlorococcus marinus XMU1424 TaxID=2774497 RepID=A0A9D9BX29_PROMR|nr:MULTISPECIES: ParA family protein [Prochlorococcus]MCH2561359.1 ParA family protein [Prochlorococcus sp. ALOHA_A2.0_50]MCR8532882.1 ParA family protein [Prochlorococcus marinus XMU1420]MCR8536586.1 ParA family protein [Prochlorococcus marinus XMU1424]MDC3034646.1 ParA family protein [Prochlorococcus sp. AH-716-P05]MBO8227340.1 ParA family protein [Prochlorococcus marinus XMU1414]
MFITVCGQKGGVAKTCTSIHLASVWHSEGKKVCIVDADKNRSALAYASRGNLPFPVFPVSSAAKASRSSEIVITDGQASSDQEELKHLAYGSDLVILPTTAKARSVELTVELANLLSNLKVNHAVVIVKVDFRQQKAAQQAKAALENFGLYVFDTFIPLLSAFDKAEASGNAVFEAVDDLGRSDPRRMTGWSAYCSIASQIPCLISKPSSDTNNLNNQQPISA